MEQTQRKAAFPDIFKYSFGGLGVQMTSTLVVFNIFLYRYLRRQLNGCSRAYAGLTVY